MRIAVGEPFHDKRYPRKGFLLMDALNFTGWQSEKSVQVVPCEGITRVLVKGQPYMSWRSGDEGCLRLAIVQLYECGLGTQAGLAEAFGRHVNSVQKYITEFACEGMRGLITERSGPKSHWKITPELRGKILLIVLREGIWKLEAIQQRLSEAWQEVVSVGSIQQVLEENGLGEQAAREVHGGAVQGELFNLEQEPQMFLNLVEDGDKAGEEIAGRTEPQEENGIGRGQSPGGQPGAGDMGRGPRRKWDER